MSQLSNAHDSSPSLCTTGITTQPWYFHIFSLPHELLQSILGSIADFEPWTYASVPPVGAENADPSGSVKEEIIPVHASDNKHAFLNLRPVHETMLGLSSLDGWLIQILARHPYRLRRSKGDRIAWAVVQALRRENARWERMYWAKKEPEYDTITVSSKPARMTMMSRYHARVEMEEEEEEEAETLPPVDYQSSTNALILYNTAPVLKITYLDLSHHLNRLVSSEHLTHLLLALYLALLHHHLSVLNDLPHDTLTPSTPPNPPKEVSTPKLSPRPRSLSGSTVTSSPSHEEPLSCSGITTVYTIGSEDVMRKRLKWGEEMQWEKEVKRPKLSQYKDRDAREEGEKEVKRPKLSQYKQVSSGRVATLMDRFEGLHL